MQQLKGKVAFITGGASGIGLAIAKACATKGMKVVIGDIEQQSLDAAFDQLTETNAEILPLLVDVTDRDAMRQAADAAESRFGKIHLLVNNAGVAVFGSLANMTYSDWDWVTRVNLDGVVNGLQEILHRIQRHGEGGHVVNTASIAGQYSFAGLGVYNATKYAVVAISETLQQDLAGGNIGVSVLCPGVVNTRIGESGRNRPGGLADTTGITPGVSNEHKEGEFSGATAHVLDPAEVGDMVLHAVENDLLYIFTHPEMAPFVKSRSDALQQAFDYWQAYRDN